jgi:D-sedoheptulose 7-phosphate isomerase
MTFTLTYLNEIVKIAQDLDVDEIDKAVDILANLQGRLFILGVGGSAANASHAVNDFRKIAGIEAYAPTDNVAELTARTNDDGWPTVFTEWLKVSKFDNQDVLLVLSVGGGTDTVSQNLTKAVQLAHEQGSKTISIVGRNTGYAAKLADACVVISNVAEERVTPHTESFQAVVWHLLVNHPKLKNKKNKAVFLDRDGTLIKLVHGRPPLNLTELEFSLDARFSLARLKNAGFKIIGVTNQPDVSRNLITKDWVESANKYISDYLCMDKIYTCFHDDKDNCECRKPKPGMLLEAAKEFNIDLKKSYMIGDSTKDIDAGKAAGCKTYWAGSEIQPLTTVIDWILEEHYGH